MTRRVVVKRKKKPQSSEIIPPRTGLGLEQSIAVRRQSASITRFPKTDEELWWWVLATWGVRIPRVAVCPNHVAPFQAFADAFFARSTVAIWKASRGFGGKTNLISLLGMSELVALGAFVTILGGSGAQSLRVHETMQEAWNYPGSPSELLHREPTKFDTYLKNGGKARTLLASSKSVRGPHPQRMRLDEIDEMELRILQDAQGQPMRKKNLQGVELETNTVMSSTHQYPDGCVDGNTKVVTKRGEIPIRDVTTEDMVMTRNGWRRVEKNIFSGFKPVVSMKLSNGRTLSVTDDHGIAVPGPVGWSIPRWFGPDEVILGIDPSLISCDPRVSPGDHSEPSASLASLVSGLDSFASGAETTSFGISASVLDSKLMTVGAMGFSFVDSGRSVSSVDISSLLDHFEMMGVDAGTISTEMVELSIPGDRANKILVGPDVSTPVEVFSVNPSVALGFSTLPNPTRAQENSSIEDEGFANEVYPIQEPVTVISIHRGTVPIPVYDLQVNETHEFVGEGVIIHNTMTKMIKEAKVKGWPVYQWSISEGSQITTYSGIKNVENVNTDDLVLTRDGWKPVQHVTRMGRKPVIHIHLSNGKTLRLTEEHLVATEQGWERADSIVAGSLLIGITSEHSEALPAVSSSIARGDVRIFRSIFMPPDAVSDCQLCDDVGCSEHVSSLSDRLDVGRTSARGVSTQVVERGARVTHKNSVSEPVSKLLSPGVIYSGFSVPSWIFSKFPFPASSYIASALDTNSGANVITVEDDFREISVSSVSASLTTSGFGVFSDGIDSTVDAQFIHVDSVTHGVIDVPVWDIGVEGQHEFTAEGIVVHNCYKESSNPVDGWLKADEIERKRGEIPTHMWNAEYDLQEPSFEGRAIDESAVERMFDPELGYSAADVGVYVELHKPHHNRDYITGVDWAKSKDFTVIWTFDATVDPWVTVAFERIQRRPWPAMIDRLNQRWARYGGKVAHDATGIGSVVSDFLVVPRGQRQADLHDIIMAGRGRNDMITNYVSAVEKNSFVVPRLQFPYEQHKFATPDDLYNGTASAHLPDSIAAGALAWSLRSTWKRVSVPVDISMRREKSPWKIG